MSVNPNEDRELLDNFELPGELSDLFQSYRAAVPVEDASANFMPGLWARIDARRRDVWSFGRLTRGFVTASGVICLVISAALWMPHKASQSIYTTTYVDELLSSSGVDEVVDAELVR